MSAIDQTKRTWDNGALLTVDELAAHLQIPRRTLYAWHSRREGPPAIRIGKYLRYTREAVERWLQARED